MQGRLKFRHDEERARAKKMGIDDENKIYMLDELATGNVMFAATGVTQGPLLDGVKFFGGGATTESLVMRSESGTIRLISSTHHFANKPKSTWNTGIKN
jgi:fructose-1,6-bisphosphatase/sedoheptulose 1,7-bisphosphatase-like protein